MVPMDRSSNSVKIEKIRRALETKNYDSALAIAKTVDSARIKSAADLSVVAEAYDKNGIYDTALVYYEQIYLKSKTRRILIHLINLCLKLSMADMAELYLRDFSEMAPRDFYRHIFRYHIDKLRGEEMEVLIYDLEQLKAENFMEDWAYELAKLYHRNGQSEECIAECNDIILWFGSGMYVDRARGLRAIHLSRLGRGGGTSEAGIAKEVRRLVEEGKGVQELEEFIEEVTIPEGNTHYSEEEYNQERFGKPVYEEEGKDVIWNTREFGAITDEMIQQQNTMDLLRGMQVAEQLRMQLGAGFEMEVEKPQENIAAEEDPAVSDKEEKEDWEIFASPREAENQGKNGNRSETKAAEDEAERVRREERSARERDAEQELYRMIEQGESEEELSKTIRKLTGSEEAAAADTVEDKHTTKRFRLWGRASEKKAQKAGNGQEAKNEEEMRATAGAEEMHTAEFVPGDEKTEEVQAGLSVLRGMREDRTQTAVFDPQDDEAGSGDVPPKEETKPAHTAEFAPEAIRRQAAGKTAGQRTESAAVHKPVSEFETFRTGAKILEARVGLSGFEQKKGQAAQGTGSGEKAEEFLPETAGDRNLGGQTDSNRKKTETEPEDDGFELRAEEEPLPEIDFEFGGEAEEEAGQEDSAEPEPLYEYPEDITADYAGEAPNLNARLRNLGMKPEEFFGGFLVSADVRRQLFGCMEHILTGRGRAINIVLTGQEKSGKTTLAKAIAKCTQVLGGIQSPRVALIRGDKLNHIDLEAKKEQLRGSTMLVEKAAFLSVEKTAELLALNAELAGETAVILEDERSRMNMFLRKNEGLLHVYNHRIDLPGWTSDDLFLQALSMLYRNEYTMTEPIAAEFLGAVRDCIEENPQNAYDAVCGYTEGVLKRAERRMAQMLREFALDGEYKEEELTMLRAEDLYER